MKVHIAIGQYEFIEVEADTPAQAREAYEAVKSFFPETPQAQAPSTQGNSGGQGTCKDCGSEMTPGKNGKGPYCKPCYIKWKDSQG